MHTIIIYTYIDWQCKVMAQFPFLLPLLVSLTVSLSIPFYLLGIHPFPWCDSVHLGPRLLVNWPPPPHSLPIPSPFQIPSTPGQLCALLRRHRDSGFTGSGTGKNHNTLWICHCCLNSKLLPAAEARGGKRVMIPKQLASVLCVGSYLGEPCQAALTLWGSRIPQKFK
jgi:hypothetical protein